MSADGDPRVAIVSGAARGIGAGIARRLARRGWTVALLDIDARAVHQQAEDMDGHAVAFEVDVTQRGSVVRSVDRIRHSLGRIDAVVANAGISNYDLIRWMSPEEFRRVVTVNLDGTFHLMQACLPHLIDSQGYFLSVSSLAAASAPPGMGAYGASKAAVEALSDTLRTEVAHLGIVVGVAYFGWIDTDLISQQEASPAYRRMRASLPALLQRVSPIDLAADAIVTGVIRRRTRVLAPSWLRILFWLRWAFTGRAARYRMAMPDIERLCYRVKGRLTDESTSGSAAP